MTVKEALEIAKTKRKTFDTCFEYPEFYVFSQSDVFDSSWAVYKDTKKVELFEPLHIPIDVLRSGKKIEI